MQFNNSKPVPKAHPNYPLNLPSDTVGVTLIFKHDRYFAKSTFLNTYLILTNFVMKMLLGHLLQKVVCSPAVTNWDIITKVYPLT